MTNNETIDLVVKTLYDALTTTWQNNGNVMAEAVHDSVIANLSKITGLTLEEVPAKVDLMAEEAQ